MREYDIKRGHFNNIDGRLDEIMKETFGNVKEAGEFFESSFGALVYIKARIKDKKTLLVDSETDKNADEETAMKTIKAFNDFLLKTTGMTAKQRAKKVQEKAKREAKKAAESQ